MFQDVAFDVNEALPLCLSLDNAHNSPESHVSLKYACLQ
jgi:hypothetical protein